MSDARETQLLAPPDIRHKTERIAAQIIEAHPDHPLALVGIHTRGAVLCRRVHEILRARGRETAFGTLDIALYRDDLDNLGTIPSIRGSDLPFRVEGAHIVLFDDVLFTGRTIRAALDELVDYGRPARIELAVLIDRGHRELPIAPDYLGQAISTARQDHVRVCFEETDGHEGVFLTRAADQP
jgi:pyrimidine operon attenuation protein/uracil phosphoribosyltransferase